MTDLETRLRDALHDAARTVEPSDTPLADVAPRRRRRHRAWVAAPIAVAAIVALVVATIALWPSHDERLNVTGGPAGPVAFFPSNLPAGWRVAPALGASALSSSYVCTDGSYATGHLACRAVAGTVSWSLRGPATAGAVMTTYGDDPTIIGRLRASGPRTTTTVRGHEAETVTFSGMTLLTWIERPGLRVSIVVPTASRLDADGIADSLVTRPVPVANVALVVASAGDVAVTARPARAGSVCMGARTPQIVLPCRFSASDVVRVFSSGQRTIVYGRFRSPTVTRVRLGTTTAEARQAAGLGGSFFVAQMASSVAVHEVDALDASGRLVARVDGRSMNDALSGGAPTPSRLPGTAPVVASNGVERLRAMWEGDEVCVELDQANGNATTGCGPTNNAGVMVEGTTGPFVFGAVSDDVAKVRAQPANGAPVVVDVQHDPRFPFGFFIVALSVGNAGPNVTLLDAQGNVVGGASASSPSASP